MKKALSIKSKIAVMNVGVLFLLLLIGFVYHYISFDLKAKALISAVRNSVLMSDYRTVNQTAASMLSSSEVLYMELPGQNRIERERAFFELPRFDVVRDFKLIKEASSNEPGQVTIRLAYSGLNGAVYMFGTWILLNVILALLYPVIVAQVEKRVVEEQRQIHLQGLVNLSRQVAHDIRSPLSALEMAIRTSEIPLARQEILSQVAKRIRGIADDLLKQSKGIHSIESLPLLAETNPLVQRQVTPVDVSSVIRGILSEKKASSESCQIQCQIPETAKVKANEIDLGRVVSNLVNNSIESLVEGRSPQVEVTVKEYQTRVAVYIKDNGKGIPSDILNQIGEIGFSHGKEKGNGLGVSFAKAKLAEWGGSLQIFSKENEGTLVTLNFLRA